MSGPLRRAVFLDRDGTLTVEGEWIRRAEELVLVPGAAAALRSLHAAGLFLVLATNQSAVARGLIDLDQLEAIQRGLQHSLEAEGARLDAFYACPHHPSEGQGEFRRVCACRKPAPGMLLEAARAHALDLPRSWMVGDAVRDLEAGWAVGARGILVATGKGRAQYEQLLASQRTPQAFVADLPAAAEHILAELAQGR